MSLSYCLPPANKSYVAAVQCITAPKGSYVPKKLYEGRDMIPDMDALSYSYNTKKLSKNIGYSFNFGVSATSNNNTGIYRPSQISGNINPKPSFNSTLLSYAK